jgi:hypothetical protein
MFPTDLKPCAVTVMAAVAAPGGVPSTVVAVRAMFAGGTLAGAVYVVGTPLVVVMGETDPHSATGQARPFSVSVQSTLPLGWSFVTVATNFVEPFNATNADVRESDTEIGGAPTVM